jgi:hypothetical protein
MARPWLPALVCALAACKAPVPEKKAAAELAGLAAVPASATVVIGADPERLAGSPVIARAVQGMLERDPDLAARVERLARACGLDWKRLDRVHLALTSEAPQPILVATGRFAEADLVACVRNTVGSGGGTVTAGHAEGRAVYEVSEGRRTVYFAFGRQDTVVLSASRPLLLTGLGGGPKVLDAPEMKPLINRARTDQPLWAVGRVDAVLGERLLRLSGGRITAPPEAFLVALDPTRGLAVELAVQMASEDDAKHLESQAKPTLALVAVAAQARGLGPLAAKIDASRDGTRVTFGAILTTAEVNELLAKVDSRAPREEDAGPAPPPGD